MMPSLREPLESLLRPLFDALPVNTAMSKLVVDQPVTGPAHDLVAKIVKDPVMRDLPQLVAGLWLYVDDLGASHTVSQSLETPTGSFWHGIMHRREGDFSNAKYWFRQVGTHPVLREISLGGGSAAAGTDIGSYDPFDFVDEVAAAQQAGNRPHELVDLQRIEWVQIFHHEAEQ